MSDAKEQVVVVSDIHLGEDLVERGPASLQTYISRLNEEFVSFLEWLIAASARRPATLVINGDMFDFVKISLRPHPNEAYMRWQQGLTAREERLGLDNSPDRVVWKLERILENHRPLFLQLARFVGLGNRLQVVAGNHDREFYYPELMEALSRALCDFYFSKHPDQDIAPARTGFVSRVGFSMWFHYTSSGIYIEHGHQYDPYCSFEYLLAPLSRAGEVKVALPLSHRAIPYFADLLGDRSTHNLDTLGPLHWARELVGMGPRMIAAILWAYVCAVASILSEAGEKARHARRALREQHLATQREVADRYHLAADLVRRLDDLRATPAEFSFFKMAQCFYVDRLSLYLVAGVGLVLEALFLEERGPFLGAVGLTLVATSVLNRILGRLRKFDTRQSLRAGAAGVMSLLHPRAIVFGHSHKPEVIPTAEGTYLNVGAWISRAALLGESDWGMTFAWLDPESEASGLYRWGGHEKQVALVSALADAFGRERAASDEVVAPTSIGGQ